MMNSNFSKEMLSRPKTTASQQGTNLNKIEGVICDRFALPIGWKAEAQSLSHKELCSMDLQLQ